MEMSYLYLNTNANQSDWIRIAIRIIPEYFVKEYNLHYKVHNGYIYEKLKRGVYGLPQYGHIAHEKPFKHLKPHGHEPV